MHLVTLYFNATVLEQHANWPSVFCWSGFLKHCPIMNLLPVLLSWQGGGKRKIKKTQQRGRQEQTLSGREMGSVNARTLSFLSVERIWDMLHLPSRGPPNYFWQHFVLLCPLSFFLQLLSRGTLRMQCVLYSSNEAKNGITFWEHPAQRGALMQHSSDEFLKQLRALPQQTNKRCVISWTAHDADQSVLNIGK